MTTDQTHAMQAIIDIIYDLNTEQYVKCCFKLEYDGYSWKLYNNSRVLKDADDLEDIYQEASLIYQYITKGPQGTARDLDTLHCPICGGGYDKDRINTGREEHVDLTCEDCGDTITATPNTTYTLGR